MMIDTKNYCRFCGCIHNKIHADFEFIMNVDVIAIIDFNFWMRSVTNDIEYVLYTINKNYETLVAPMKFKGLQHYKIIYKDSLGKWNKIILDDLGKFSSIDIYKEEMNINDAFKAVSDKAIML